MRNSEAKLRRRLEALEDRRKSSESRSVSEIVQSDTASGAASLASLWADSPSDADVLDADRAELAAVEEQEHDGVSGYTLALRRWIDSGCDGPAPTLEARDGDVRTAHVDRWVDRGPISRSEKKFIARRDAD